KRNSIRSRPCFSLDVVYSLEMIDRIHFMRDYQSRHSTCILAFVNQAKDDLLPAGSKIGIASVVAGQESIDMDPTIHNSILMYLILSIRGVMGNLHFRHISKVMERCRVAR